MHNIKEAHNYSLGKDVKVGVIDWLFNHSNCDLYSNSINLTTNDEQLEMSGHGFWMASTLREIAPECEIIAINAIDYSSEENRAILLIKAIDWAINNKINILTYSHSAFLKNENKKKVYDAISRANKSGIITTFIHCDSLYNIWPYGCMPFDDDGHSRFPDVNILHYDYSVLFPNVYEKYFEIISRGEKVKSGNDIPFFSFSSLSVVLGGFIALLKSYDRSLSFSNCRKLLIDSSYAIIVKATHWYDINSCSRCVDIGNAIKILALSKTK